MPFEPKPPPPIKTLEQVKGRLYELFNEASDKHKTYEDPPRGSINSYALNNHAVQNRIALGVLAQAIADVEREQREKGEKGDAAPIKKLGAR